MIIYIGQDIYKLEMVRYIIVRFGSDIRLSKIKGKSQRFLIGQGYTIIYI